MLYSFSGGSDGKNPESGLIDVNGTLYGTTPFGGGSGPKIWREAPLFDHVVNGENGLVAILGSSREPSRRMRIIERNATAFVRPFDMLAPHLPLTPQSSRANRHQLWHDITPRRFLMDLVELGVFLSLVWGY